ncbi:putative plant self-incompatibility S1 [Rosa chinensis]|uniref:S-protein homolog n=1 Tax=Rosa chinensis TaxID=74649 RepID=A0A2P6PQ76_ROSCH|nr:putative plant self-incompatibility S1 [Rosa chinensis]
MALFIGKVVLLMLVLSLTVMTISGEDIGRKTRHIKILNDLDGNFPLTVHCKSADDDIGEKTLRHGAVYEFSFQPKVIPRTTLFFCSFQWNSILHHFNVYYEGVDCSECWYTVKNDGKNLCRYDFAVGQYDLCYVWND